MAESRAGGGGAAVGGGASARGDRGFASTASVAPFSPSTRPHRLIADKATRAASAAPSLFFYGVGRKLPIPEMRPYKPQAPPACSQLIGKLHVPSKKHE